MEPLAIVTRWTWRPDSFYCRILDIRGGEMPPEVRHELQGSGPPDFGAGSRFHRMAKPVVEYVGMALPAPQPIDLGGTVEIAGHITGIQLFGSRSSDAPDENHVSFEIEYENGHRTEGRRTFKLAEFPEPIARLIEQLHRETNSYATEWFWSNHGKGERSPEKWKAEKIRVFISYRAKDRRVAKQLFDGLGQYQDSSIFLPKPDFVDMQAGNWMDQLMKTIDECAVFIPILSREYLRGPSSRTELDQAMRQSLSGSEKRIIPLLIEGSPEEYQSHFIGGYHMLLAREGITPERVEEIAYLALGLSRNPYE